MRAKPRDPTTTIPRKQRAKHEDFVRALREITTLVSRAEIEDLVERTVADIRAVTAGKRAAYAWSGGKDSLALQVVAERAGIPAGVFTMTDLEYPAFLAWVTDHMPDGLSVVRATTPKGAPLDLDWLAAHPDMLFPKDATTAGKWFAQVQHAGVERHYAEERLDIVLLGRRAADGNYMGDDGSGIYASRGCLRYSPCQHWRHEDVLAACHYFGYELPPIYDWPRGFRVGTGSWPARQWTTSVEHGWAEVYTIDSSIVYAAAEKIPSARAFLDRR